MAPPSWRCILALLTAASVLGAARSSRAQTHPLPVRLELRLEPVLAAQSIIGTNGLLVTVPSGPNSDTTTTFGFGASLGFLVTPTIEPGFSLRLSLEHTGDSTATIFGMVPFLKFNLWSAHHINPFFEPFAGFSIIDPGRPFQSQSFFDGGFFAGADFLVTTWGIRLWSGFEALANGDQHIFGIPVRWALVAYF
jgi:hypothetical protein